MLKGPKRTFVVLDLILGVESKAKNVHNGTKIVQGKGTKNVHVLDLVTMVLINFGFLHSSCSSSAHAEIQIFNQFLSDEYFYLICAVSPYT